MTLSDLAALGNFIGGIAVVVSFGFLAFQLRQSTHNQRTSIAIQRTALTQGLSLSIFAQDLPLWIRGGVADPNLTGEEIGRYQGMVLLTLWLYEEHFYQHRDGMLDPGRWATNIKPSSHLPDTARLSRRLARPLPGLFRSGLSPLGR